MTQSPLVAYESLTSDLSCGGSSEGKSGLANCLGRVGNSPGVLSPEDPMHSLYRRGISVVPEDLWPCYGQTECICCDVGQEPRPPGALGSASCAVFSGHADPVTQVLWVLQESESSAPCLPTVCPCIKNS